MPTAEPARARGGGETFSPAPPGTGRWPQQAPSSEAFTSVASPRPTAPPDLRRSQPGRSAPGTSRSTSRTCRTAPHRVGRKRRNPRRVHRPLAEASPRSRDERINGQRRRRCRRPGFAGSVHSPPARCGEALDRRNRGRSRHDDRPCLAQNGASAKGQPSAMAMCTFDRCVLEEVNAVGEHRNRLSDEGDCELEEEIRESAGTPRSGRLGGMTGASICGEAMGIWPLARRAAKRR